MTNRKGIPNGKSTGIHRWMFMMTNGPIPKGIVIMHTCDNPACINPKHLEAGTQKDNMKDCEIKKRHSHGESHGMHVITEEDAIKIKKYLSNGFSHGNITALFGYSKHIVKDIQRNKTWKHVG
jgi:hypothetical protein